MRSNRLWLIGVLALYSWLALVCHSYAAFPSESLTIGYSSFSGHYVPLWIAIEDHLGKKYGLVWRKYLRGASDDILEESYQSTLGVLERVPLPSLPVIKSGLDVLAVQYPQAKQTDPSLIIDPTFVKRIEQSGFIDALYKK